MLLDERAHVRKGLLRAPHQPQHLRQLPMNARAISRHLRARQNALILGCRGGKVAAELKGKRQLFTPRELFSKGWRSIRSALQEKRRLGGLSCAQQRLADP